MKKIYHGGVRPYVEAHRGASNLRPENTMSSFEKSVELGADFIEIDVQFTKDKCVVVFHDDKIDRTTNGSGRISDLTLEEVKRLDAGSWFSEDYSFERIPTLEETLKWAKDKIWLSIELKHIPKYKDEFVKTICELILKYDMDEQVQLISFNHDMLKDVRKYSDLITTSAICPCKIHNPVNYLKEIEAQVYNGPASFLSEREISEMKKHGILVNGGMVNDSASWKLYESWGVDLMCTDVPEVMVKLRDAHVVK